MSLSDFIVTFGKHRGQTLEDLVNDGEYYGGWLMRQPWWPEKWEAKVIHAVRTRSEIPPQPKVRPILEQEYDWAIERPAKVRKITHRAYGPKHWDFECPSCGDNAVKRVKSDLATAQSSVCVICLSCGQHAVCAFGQNGSHIAASIDKIDCPKWRGKTQEDYVLACETCPDKKGYYADHTSCGCWRAFECECQCE